VKRSKPIVALALTLLLSACDTALQHVSGGLPFFPTLPERDGPQVVDLARANGTLTLENGCLWLRSGQERHLMIWLAAHRVEWDAGELVILNGSNSAQAGVGSEIVVGGGEWRDSESSGDIDVQIERLIGRAVPPACRQGLYWVGGVIAK
jgi:hypothetical protein